MATRPKDARPAQHMLAIAQCPVTPAASCGMQLQQVPQSAASCQGSYALIKPCGHAAEQKASTSAGHAGLHARSTWLKEPPCCQGVREGWLHRNQEDINQQGMQHGQAH